MFVSEWILITLREGQTAAANSSKSEEAAKVEFPLTEWLQFLGVPTPEIRMRIF